MRYFGWMAVRRGLGAGTLLLVASAGPALGQGMRGEVRVSTGFLEARPLVRDSIPDGAVPGGGLQRRLDDGTLVTCMPGNFCRWFRAGDVDQIVVTTQEFLATGWTGVQGLSTKIHLRGRYGSDDFWPQSNQEFETVSAFADFDRSDYRVRAGRIFRTDGLGYYNFDGASFLWRGWSPLWVEVYGGWGLARGINAPRSGDLVSEIDPLATDDRGLIFGAEAGGRIGRIASGRVSYQREIRTDRLGLYSERLAFDGRAFLHRTVIEVSGEYDFTFEKLNELRLRLNTPIASNLEIVAEARRHSPYFELWTIWGAFSPVGFDEGRLTLAWSDPDLGLGLQAGGAYREYDEADAGPANSVIRDDGWRAFANADLRRGAWFASGGYRAEAGFGAARFGGDFRAGRFFGDDTYISLRGSRTQTFGEFRLNEQLVSGIGLDGAVKVGEFSLNAGAALYRIESEERLTDGDWTQARFYSSLSYRFGLEPGVGSRANGRSR